MSTESLESSFPAWFRWLRMWRALHVLGLGALLLVTVAYAHSDVPVRSPQFLIGMFFALLIWAVPFGQLALLECPRCHHRFFWTFGRFMVVFFFFQSRCSHCRLPQYGYDDKPTEGI